MTVEELIEQLEKCDQKAIMVMSAEDYIYNVDELIEYSYDDAKRVMLTHYL